MPSNHLPYRKKKTLPVIILNTIPVDFVHENKRSVVVA